MTEENEKMTEEKLQQKVTEALDELGDSAKKTSRKIFNGMVERTVEVFSEMLDKQKIILKKKIQGVNNDKEEPKEKRE